MYGFGFLMKRCSYHRQPLVQIFPKKSFYGKNALAGTLEEF